MNGQKSMFDVLKMFVIWDKEKEIHCGYVQGMNFLAGALSYHASPIYAFCLFVKLLIKYEIL